MHSLGQHDQCRRDAHRLGLRPATSTPLAEQECCTRIRSLIAGDLAQLGALNGRPK